MSARIIVKAEVQARGRESVTTDDLRELLLRYDELTGLDPGPPVPVSFGAALTVNGTGKAWRVWLEIPEPDET